MWLQDVDMADVVDPIGGSVALVNNHTIAVTGGEQLVTRI